MQASLRAYDNKTRRKQVNKIIQEARDITGWAVSKNRLVALGMRCVIFLGTTLGLRFSPGFGPDVANSMEVASLDEELA